MADEDTTNNTDGTDDTSTTDDATGGADKTTDGDIKPFFQTLSPENQDGDALKGFDSVDALATAHKELLSKQVVVPEGPDKYEFKNPDGFQGDKIFDEILREAAHAQGLSQEMAAGIRDAYNQKIIEGQADQEKISAENISALKKEWGASFTNNLAIADKALNIFGSGELVKLLTSMGIKDYPEVVTFFHKIGVGMSEDSMGKGGETSPEEMPRTPSGVPMPKGFFKNTPSMQGSS